MSVRERLEDAILLWEHGRKEGAWIQVLIAAAATSRMRLPKPVPDKEAFTTFIKQVSPTIVTGSGQPCEKGITFMIGEVALEDVIYKHLRCNLVHEADIADKVTLHESRVVDGKLFGQFGGHCTKDSPLTIPDFWVLNLGKAVADAPENAATCGELFALASAAKDAASNSAVESKPAVSKSVEPTGSATLLDQLVAGVRKPSNPDGGNSTAGQIQIPMPETSHEGIREHFFARVTSSTVRCTVRSPSIGLGFCSRRSIPAGLSQS